MPTGSRHTSTDMCLPKRNCSHSHTVGAVNERRCHLKSLKGYKAKLKITRKLDSNEVLGYNKNFA